MGALSRELLDRVILIIRQIKMIFLIDPDAVRSLKLPLSPTADKIPLVVKHNDRMLTTIENIDTVLGVNGDASRFVIRPT
tara:strand:- start:212 stop:451 length:240 start_codon:yes stop_codon:yes gene_type:complete